MKLRIIGGPGSGKSTLANLVSKEFSISHLDLDDLKYANSSDYSNPTPSKDRAVLLSRWLSKNSSWVIEGVSNSSWVWHTYSDSDLVIILKTNIFIEYSRIIVRYFKKLFGLEAGRKDSFSGSLGLLPWVIDYRKNYLSKLITKMNDQKIRNATFKNYSDALAFLKKEFKK